jgi:hypothetical protein
MNIGLFIHNQSIFIAILTAVIIFPINLNANAYLNYYQWKSQAVIDYFPYFFYPWSIQKLFASDVEILLLISLVIQYVILSLLPFSLEFLKNIFTKKEKQVFF